MPFASGPILRYIGGGRYATVGPTVYVGSDDVITIPADFPTDLATVPRIFWALLPPQGAYERAAVLHDWLCVQLAKQHAGTFRVDIDDETPERGWTRRVSARDVDGLFRRVMREAGVGLAVRWVMWVGVRWGALANPARRAGWWRDSPLVLAITALILTATAAATWGADRALHNLTALLTR